MWKTSVAAIGFLIGCLVGFPVIAVALIGVHELARAWLPPGREIDDSLFLAVLLWGATICGLIGGIIGYRAGTRRDGREAMRIRILFSQSDPQVHPRFISTFSLLAVLLTAWAWGLEFTILMIYLFVQKQLDPIGHGMLLTVASLLTVFSWNHGRKELEKVSAMRGNIPMTVMQAWIIVAACISMGAFCALAAARLVGR